VFALQRKTVSYIAIRIAVLALAELNLTRFLNQVHFGLGGFLLSVSLRDAFATSALTVSQFLCTACMGNAPNHPLACFFAPRPRPAHRSEDAN